MAHVVKSLFGKPRCSDCGNVIRYTPRAFPFPQYTCDHCSRMNRDKDEKERQIADLQRQINELKQFPHPIDKK